MRHNKKGRKLGTDASHTKAMKRSLVAALFTNDRIKTIESRAKEIRPDVDHIITWAKKGDLHSRRLAIAALGDKELVREVFEKVEQGMFKGRDGGYTRILKLGPRKGDAAPMVIMELVNEGVRKKTTPQPAAANPTRGRRTRKAAEKPAAEAESAAKETEWKEEVAEELDAAADDGTLNIEEATDIVDSESAAEAEHEEEAREAAFEAEEKAAENAEAAVAERMEKDKPE